MFTAFIASIFFILMIIFSVPALHFMLTTGTFTHMSNYRLARTGAVGMTISYGVLFLCLFTMEAVTEPTKVFILMMTFFFVAPFSLYAMTVFEKGAPSTSR